MKGVTPSSQRILAFVASCVFALLQPRLQAVCFEFAFKELRANRDIALIFHGTVRDVQLTTSGEIVTFDVLRVWKGRVPPQITIYNRGSPSELSEWLSFVRDTGYFVSAYRLSRENRTAFGLPDSNSAVYGAGYCTAHVADASRARADAENNPGRGPSR
jgi:hypothetical protein